MRSALRAFPCAHRGIYLLKQQVLQVLVDPQLPLKVSHCSLVASALSVGQVHPATLDLYPAELLHLRNGNLRKGR